ncbi:hypothetical protein Aros01_07626 [Streptosporangium roseum]
MTAQEQHDQRVVPVRLVGVVGGGRGPPFRGRLRGHQLLPAAAGLLVAHLLGHPAERDLDEPAAWIARHTLLRPLGRGVQQRLLDRVLGGVEVPGAAGEHADDLRREFAQQVVDGRIVSAHSSSGGADITWRTSIGMFNGLPPGPGAAERDAASSIARSWLSQSTIQ